jgi:hypothetical protein
MSPERSVTDVPGHHRLVTRGAFAIRLQSSLCRNDRCLQRRLTIVLITSCNRVLSQPTGPSPGAAGCPPARSPRPSNGPDRGADLILLCLIAPRRRHLPYSIERCAHRAWVREPEDRDVA